MTSRIFPAAAWIAGRRLAAAIAAAFIVAAPAVAAQDKDAAAPSLECKTDGREAQDFRRFALCEAKLAGLPPELATTVMEIESGFDPDVKGDAGEIGLMQVMPPTARLLGFQGDDAALAEPAVNIRLGVRYLAKAHRLAGGDLCTTVMKYRAGHAQTKFSARSVAYCLRARKILHRDGYTVTGSVPAATLATATTGSKRRNRTATVFGVCVTRSSLSGPPMQDCFRRTSVKVTRLSIDP